MQHLSFYRHAVVALLGILLAAGAMLAPADEPASMSDPALRAYAAASGLLERELYAEAIPQFRKFLQEHSGHAYAPLARYGLGIALYRTDQPAEAEQTLGSLLSRSGFEFAGEVRAVVGQCRLARGDFAGAADVLTPFVNDLRTHAVARDAGALFVEALYQAGRHAEAAKAAAEWLERWPDIPTRERVLYVHALASLAAGDWTVAEQSFAGLRQQFPQSAYAAQAALLGGRAAFEQAAYDRARDCLAPLTSRELPERDLATYWLAKCELRAARPAEAAALLSAVLARTPAHPLAAEMRYDRGVALAQAGEDDAAVGVLREFLEQNAAPDLRAGAVQLLAHLELQRGKYQECAALCAEFARLYPDHADAPEVAFLAAESAYLDGRLAAAMTQFSDFLRRWPEHERAAQGQLRVGLALYRLERFEEAQPHLERVVALSRDDALFHPARLALAEVLFRRGEWKPAASAYEAYLASAAAAGADEALLKLGIAQHRGGDSVAAAQTFQRLLEQHADSPWRTQARFEQGQLLLAQNDAEGARRAFDEVVKSAAPQLVPLAHYHLGVLALNAGQPADAAEHFARAAETQPDLALSADARLQQGQALAAAGKHAEASAALRTFLERNPDHELATVARARLVLALARQQQPADALALADTLVQSGAISGLPPDLARALAYERAWCLRTLERREEAASTYREYLAQHTSGAERPYAVLELAELEAAADHCAEAVRLLAEVTAPDSAPDAVRIPALYRTGICAFEQKDYDRAAAALGTMLERAPAHSLAATAHFYRAEALFQLGRHKAAADQLTQLLDTQPPDDLRAPALLRLGECHTTLQQWTAAERSFEDFLRAFPASDQQAQAHFGVGWARENQGRHTEAIRAYRAALELHNGPTAARAQFQIGECLFAQGKPAEAVTELLNVDILYAYPEWSAAALYEAGRCFESLGKTVEARRQFETVCQKYKDSKWAELAGARLAAVAGDGLPGRKTN